MTHPFFSSAAVCCLPTSSYTLLHIYITSVSTGFFTTPTYEDFSTTSSPSCTASISVKTSRDDPAAANQKCQPQESACAVCFYHSLVAQLGAASSSFSSSTMYQVVRKLFFTDCQCVEKDASKTYDELFAKLDTNKDGKVDVSELKAGLSAMGIKTGKGAAQVIDIQ